VVEGELGRWSREVGGGFLELSFVFFLLLLLFLLCFGPLHASSNQLDCT
jgi:hypothetical protein